VLSGRELAALSRGVSRNVGGGKGGEGRGRGEPAAFHGHAQP